MKKLFTTTALAAIAATVVVAGAAFAASTAAHKTVAFTAKYTGTATTQSQDSTVNITANGTGSGTLIGSGKVTGAGVGNTATQPCVPFTGTGSMSGKSGVITFKVIPGSSGCGDEQGEVFSVSGKLTVLKATGKLAKATGTLRMSGTFDRSNGAFSVKFFGSLKK